MSDIKRVCVINKKDNMIMRVTKAYAKKLIDSNPLIFKFTSKANLHKFLKIDKKNKYQTEIGARRLAAFNKKKRTKELVDIVETVESENSIFITGSKVETIE